MKMPLLILASLLIALPAWAHDPDLNYILKAVEGAPCSQLQVLIAKNIGAIRWAGGSVRYLFADDVSALKGATLSSGKRTIDVDRELPVPNLLSDPNWPVVENQLEAILEQLFTADFQAHLPDGC